MKRVFLSLLLLLKGSILLEALPDGIKLPKGDLQPFMEKHCIQCHGPDKQKGQVRFDQVNWVIDNPDTAQRWQDVLDVLNGGEMPPEEEDQPGNEELTGFLQNLTESMEEARARLTDHGGAIKMRRLNKREYVATMRELFGFNINEIELPEEGEALSFDTVGDEQFFTSIHFDGYLKVARKTITEALHWSTQARREKTNVRRDLGMETYERIQKQSAEYDAQLAKVNQGLGFKESGFNDAGDLEIFKRQHWIHKGVPKRYLELPRAKEGVYFTGNAFNEAKAWVDFDVRADYIYRFHGGIVGNPDDMRKQLVMTDNRGEYQGSVRIMGTENEPETVEVRLSAGTVKHRFQRVGIKEFWANRDLGYLRKLHDAKDVTQVQPTWASIWLDWYEVEGPLYPKERPVFEQILYPNGYPEVKIDKPSKNADGTPFKNGKDVQIAMAQYNQAIKRATRPELFSDQNARKLIQKFAFHAFRRKAATSAYIDALHTVFRRQRASGLKFEEAIIEPLAIILSSPKFLFIGEQTQKEGVPTRLTDRELAVRLAYFLWSRPPDSELYQVAKANLLKNPTVIKRQIDRMLDDPKSMSFRDGYMSQWAELERFDAISVDIEKHPTFSDNLRASARQEAREFFGALIQSNLTAKNFIDSDFVVVNGALAAHYGLKNFKSRFHEFSKVKLPKDSPRGGLLTQTHFLVSGSNGERSSPVIRGALVMEKLLNDKPAPPPPNVPELEEASSKPLTNRLLVEMHQERAACASCHKKIDAIGFGLESFDSIGQWRDNEVVIHNGMPVMQVPIKTSGELPGGGSFENLEGLKKVLMNHEKDLARELTQTMMSYAIGRRISFADQDDIEDILLKLEGDNYPVRDMIKEIALSKLFQMK